VSRLPDRVSLIGFMGSGKSTVGQMLARRLGYFFLDLDRLIEQQAGMTIPRIFREEGEKSFRLRESACLASIQARKRIVIAAGGGAPIAEMNRDFFARQSTTFFLSVRFETALGRTQDDGERPLLAGGQEEARKLYEARLPVYLSLGRSIETEGRAPAEITREILDLLRSPTVARDSGESD